MSLIFHLLLLKLSVELTMVNLYLTSSLMLPSKIFGFFFLSLFFLTIRILYRHFFSTFFGSYYKKTVPLLLKLVYYIYTFINKKSLALIKLNGQFLFFRYSISTMGSFCDQNAFLLFQATSEKSNSLIKMVSVHPKQFHS
jgi:hypothetical protein